MHDEGEDQGQLDGCLTGLGPGPPTPPAHFTEPMTCAEDEVEQLADRIGASTPR